MNNTSTTKIDAQFQSLLDTVERLRKDKFSTLNPDLVRNLLLLHATGTAVDADLTRAIEQQVEEYLGQGE